MCFLGYLLPWEGFQRCLHSLEASVVTEIGRDSLEVERESVHACTVFSLWTQPFGICDVLYFKLAGESLGNSSPSLLFAHPPPSLTSPFLFSVLNSPSGFFNFNEFIGMTNVAKANSTESQCLGIDFTVGRGGWGLRPHSHCGLLSLSEVVAGCQKPCSLGFPASADSPALSLDRENILWTAEVSSEVWSLKSKRGENLGF